MIKLRLTECKNKSGMLSINNILRYFILPEIGLLSIKIVKKRMIATKILPNHKRKRTMIMKMMKAMIVITKSKKKVKKT